MPRVLAWKGAGTCPITTCICICVAKQSRDGISRGPNCAPVRAVPDRWIRIHISRSVRVSTCPDTRRCWRWCSPEFGELDRVLEGAVGEVGPARGDHGPVHELVRRLAL